jgi:DNA transformation protein
MKTTSEFADHCLDLFSGLPRVEARTMFGGHAFYVGPAMFAIGDADEWKVWLKVDDETRARFEAAGGVAFTYTAKNRGRTTMSFFTPPDDALEDAEAMLPWARLALEAAERAVRKRGAKLKGAARPLRGPADRAGGSPANPSTPRPPARRVSRPRSR